MAHRKQGDKNRPELIFLRALTLSDILPLPRSHFPKFPAKIAPLAADRGPNTWAFWAGHFIPHPQQHVTPRTSRQFVVAKVYLLGKNPVVSCRSQHSTQMQKELGEDTAASMTVCAIEEPKSACIPHWVHSGQGELVWNSAWTQVLGKLKWTRLVRQTLLSLFQLDLTS
jgi:hypothetical protein